MWNDLQYAWSKIMFLYWRWVLIQDLYTVARDGLDKNLWSLHNSLMDLLTFLIMVLKILIYRLYRGVFYMEFELPGYCSTLTLGGFVFNFTRKNDFLSFLRRIRVKIHFPLMSPVFVLSESSFNWFTKVYPSRTTQKREVWCDDNFDDKSLM